VSKLRGPGRPSVLAERARFTAVLMSLLAIAGSSFAEPSSAVRHQALGVPGLQAPAKILVDQWGVAHIRAASERDAFFLQGWNAARDRLWQIDLWRKRGLGLLSASFGAAYADQDRAARLFLYRGDMAAEWAAYGAKAQAGPTRSSPESTPMSPRLGLGDCRCRSSSS
jgi:penicillin amidase